MALSENLPPELALMISDLQRNEEDARRLVAGLDAGQLNWQPNGGKGWSILQCLEHLTLSNELYLGSMTRAVERADRVRAARKGAFEPGLLARVFLGSLEPPVKLKGPAPRAIQPASKGDPAAVMAGWLKSHEGLRRLAGVAAPLDLGGVMMRNPFFNAVRMKLGTAVLVLPAHERRHLWQAGNVRRGMEGARR